MSNVNNLSTRQRRFGRTKVYITRIVNLSVEDDATLVKLAEDRGWTLSDVIRHLIRNGAGE